jgi:hypothetical protein
VDEQRFDALVKRLARSSRRQVLARLLGGLAAVVGMHEVDARKKRDKKGHDKKRVRASAAKGGASCTPGGPCAPNGKCCPGEKCVNGTCASPCKGKGKGGGCPAGTTCCNGACVPSCVSPRVLDPTTCACGGCPSGCPAPPTHQDPTTCGCSCPAITCGPDTVQDPTTCQCVCTLTCQGPKVLDPSTCTCGCPPVTCSGLQVVDPATCECACPNSCAAPQVVNPSTCACECGGGCGTCEACDPERGCVSTGVDSFVVNQRPPCGSGPQGCFCTTDKDGRGFCSSGGACEGQSFNCATDADCAVRYGPGAICAPTASPSCFGGVACLTPCPNP